MAYLHVLRTIIIRYKQIYQKAISSLSEPLTYVVKIPVLLKKKNCVATG